MDSGSRRAKARDLSVLQCVVLLLSFSGQGAVPSATRGIGPAEKLRYEAAVVGDSFQCLDGSGALIPAVLNDDFCDCADGSDEPGTAACAGQAPSSLEVLYYCPNEGSQPQYVYPSRVNDGVCDCCDGSDEWFKRLVVCRDSCHEEGQAFREAEEQRIQRWQQGKDRHRELLEVAKAKEATWKEAAERLRQDAARLKQDRDERKAALKGPAPASPSPAVQASGSEEEKPKVSEYAKWMEGGSAKVAEVAAPTGAVQASKDNGTALKDAKFRRTVLRLRELEAQLDPRLRDTWAALATLAGECWEKKIGEFDYRICMFRKAVQSTPSEKNVSLGRWKRWDFSGARPRAVFERGASCPGGHRRQITVAFTCAREASIEAVSEPRTCVYEAEVRHAAACDAAEWPDKAVRQPRQPKDEL